MPMAPPYDLVVLGGGTFTDPEVAHVGLTQEQARERWGGGVTLARSTYNALDRAVTEGDTEGFIGAYDPHADSDRSE